MQHFIHLVNANYVLSLTFQMFLALTLPVILVIIFKLWQKWSFSIRQRLFATYMSGLSEAFDLALQSRKPKHVEKLKHIVSSDSELRVKKQIRILEIGCGSGANLKHFPEGSRLIMLDLNEQFFPKLRENLNSYPGLILERIVRADAAAMQEHVADNSVDVVMSQYVLCSCDDVPAVLREVHRVLAPAGSFFFIEHVIDKPGTFRRLVQRFLMISKIWPYLGCGCDVAKDCAKFFKNAGFTKIESEDFYMASRFHPSFHFIKPNIIGVATK
ncbi:hypothetical protein B566_EDAN004421 [Ephemera danica]|nr:hypothetical protein B566_EDAN004421 [Ephemera danica]